MAKIHGIVYILAGLLVSIVSWRIDYAKLILFFYTGLVFIFIGVAKLIYNSIKSSKNKVQTLHHKTHHERPQQIKYCHNCGSESRINGRFCSKCGVRL